VGRPAERVGPYVDQTIDLMREGMRRGLVQPRIVMERVPAQIARQVVDDPSASPFFGPFARMPASIPASDQQRLRTEALRAIEREVVPAYGACRISSRSSTCLRAVTRSGSGTRRAAPTGTSSAFAGSPRRN